MTTNLFVALQLSLVGMALVFGAILALWLLMALLVRLTADRAPQVAEAGYKAPAAEQDLKQQAAAAAVAFALAGQAAAAPPRVASLPATATVSAWQAVMRGRQLKQRGSIR
jgi:Na+-transporting methylmalonyl-CoA/oxaloacetate decarboxylase gamma subunit